MSQLTAHPLSPAAGVAATPARPRSRDWRHKKEKAFLAVCFAASALSLGALATLLTTIALQGVTYLDWDFLTGTPSRFADEAGIWPPLVGTVLTCVVCAITAIPIGVATAVLLEEYRPRHPLLRRAHGFVQLNITNLAGVPSIVYGILGLTAFVQMFNVAGTAITPSAEAGVEFFDRYQTAAGRFLMVPVASKDAPATDPAAVAAAGGFRDDDGEPIDIELLAADALAPRQQALEAALAAFEDDFEARLEPLEPDDDRPARDPAAVGVEVGAAFDAAWQSAGLTADRAALKARLVPGIAAAQREGRREFSRAVRYSGNDVEQAEAQARFAGVLDAGAEPVRDSRAKPWYVRIPFGRSVLAGGLTLMLVVLPVVIIASQESLRAVPKSLRQASLALGATPWQTVRGVTLPSAVPGILTGTILAMSRAIGEAAPILVIAGIVYITFVPKNLMDDFTVMPLQVYEWARRPQEDLRRLAASGIIVLLAVLLAFNGVAVWLRHRAEGKAE